MTAANDTATNGQVRVHANSPYTVRGAAGRAEQRVVERDERCPAVGDNTEGIGTCWSHEPRCAQEPGTSTRGLKATGASSQVAAQCMRI
jgi:hypothetical protein